MSTVNELISRRHLKAHYHLTRPDKLSRFNTSTRRTFEAPTPTYKPYSSEWKAPTPTYGVSSERKAPTRTTNYEVYEREAPTRTYEIYERVKLNGSGEVKRKAPTPTYYKPYTSPRNGHFNRSSPRPFRS